MSGLADIFISYSASDDTSGKDSTGWVTHLEGFLGLFLKNLLGRKIEIVLDADGSVKPEARSFIYIVSKDHVNSDSGIGKFEDFLKTTKNTDGVFKILKSDVAHADQPEALQAYYAYNLFDGKKGEGNLFEGSTDSATWLRLVDLAYDLYNQIADSSESTSKSLKDLKTVFLAEVSEEQEQNRDMIKRELLMHGYNVLPKKHLSKNAEDIIQEVNDHLSQSSLAIHIIGENPGFLPEGSDVSIVELQNSVAAQYSEKIYDDDKTSNDFTRLLWISPDIEFENEQQRMEVEQLKQDMSALRGAEVILTPIEMFKTIIMLRLNETFDLQEEENTGGSERRVVYLIYEKAFSENIAPIDSALKKSGIKTLHPLFEGDQIELINTHRVNLIDCDATLIYYNTDNEHWIESKVKEFKKSPGFGRKKPFLANAVLKSDKLQVQNNKLISENMDIIDMKGDFKAEILNPFLDKLKN